MDRGSVGDTDALSLVLSEDEIIADQQLANHTGSDDFSGNKHSRRWTSLPEKSVADQLNELMRLSNVPEATEDANPKRRHTMAAVKPIDSDAVAESSTAHSVVKREAQRMALAVGNSVPLLNDPSVALLGSVRRRGRRHSYVGGAHRILGRRVSSVNAFREEYEISAEMDELIQSALARRYRDRKYNDAALLIQMHYRQYKLRQRFERLRREGCHDSALDQKDGVVPIEASMSKKTLTESGSGLRGSNERIISAPTQKLDEAMRLHNIEQGQGPKLTEREREMIIKRGIYTFNQRPNKGVEYMRIKGVLSNEPRDLALLLLEGDERRISKYAIGQYLAKDKDVLVEFANAYDFSGMHFHDALGQFLMRFRLVGEAQIVDRTMEAFAKRYFVLNRDHPEFETPDTVFILAYSTIMLHTDAHNPNVARKNKMTKEGFIKNNRGINNKRDLSYEYLSDLYDRVLGCEWRPHDVHMDEVRAVVESLKASTNVKLQRIEYLAQPYRYLVATHSFALVKDYVARIGGSHPRKLYLFNDMLLVVKPSKKGPATAKELLPLAGLMRISASNSKLFPNAFELHNLNKHVKLGPFCIPRGDEGITAQKFLELIDEYTNLATFMEKERIAQMDLVNDSPPSSPKPATSQRVFSPFGRSDASEGRSPMIGRRKSRVALQGVLPVLSNPGEMSLKPKTDATLRQMHTTNDTLDDSQRSASLTSDDSDMSSLRQSRARLPSLMNWLHTRGRKNESTTSVAGSPAAPPRSRSRTLTAILDTPKAYRSQPNDSTETGTDDATMTRSMSAIIS